MTSLKKSHNLKGEARAIWLRKLEHWFKYLRLSPSYELANIFRKTGRLTIEQMNQLPDAFDLVLKTYDDFGDVWECDFSTWLKTNPAFTAQFGFNRDSTRPITSLLNAEKEDFDSVKEAIDHFCQTIWKRNGYPPTVLMAVALKEPKEKSLAAVGAQIDLYKQAVKEGYLFDQLVSKKFQPLKTKARESVLNTCYKIVTTKALNPKMTWWKISLELGINKAQTDKILEVESLKLKSKRVIKGQSATVEKMNINAIMGRHMRNAFLLAENAALGSFPSFIDNPNLDGLKSKTKFNLISIAKGLELESERAKKVV